MGRFSEFTFIAIILLIGFISYVVVTIRIDNPTIQIGSADIPVLSSTEIISLATDSCDSEKYASLRNNSSFYKTKNTLKLVGISFSGNSATSSVIRIGYADDAFSCAVSLTNPVIQYRLNIPDNDLIFNQDIYLNIPVNKYPFIQIDGLYNWEVSAVGIDK